VRADVYVDCIRCAAVIKSVNVEAHMTLAHGLTMIKVDVPATLIETPDSTKEN
jgi:hypothetical protein